MATFNDEEFSSDTSDEDYVPGGEVASDEDETGEDEALLECEDEKQEVNKKKGKIKRKRKQESSTRKRQGGIKLDCEYDNVEHNEETDDFNDKLKEQVKKEEESKKEENEKKKVDDLWASFKADVPSPKFRPKADEKSHGIGCLSSIVKSVPTPSCAKTDTGTAIKKPPVKSSDKVTITKEFDFAGETIKVTEEVDVNSKEAKKEIKKQETNIKNVGNSAGSSIPPLKRPGGLGGVLGLINKKPKISTLEKSKLDWEQFKSKEGIQEELQIHNRGKEGYLERQAFLNRTDTRQFEIERDIRLNMTGKR